MKTSKLALSGGFRLPFSLLLVWVVSLGEDRAAAQSPTYAGRPFVLISRANANDPVAGFIQDFGRAQVVGDAVVFVTRDAAFNPSGIFRGRGGPLTKLAAAGTATPAGTLQFFHQGFARNTTAGHEVVIAAGPARADALLRTDGTNWATLLPGGSALPNSGGKVANVVLEPFQVGEALAVIAAHETTPGSEDFRGVYRVKAGALEAVADTATELPGLGVPGTFSSQVGFDGQSLAFWAARGPLGQEQGMFVQADGGPVKLIARTGDTFPDGGAMDRFYSPPFVAGGAVYFFAYDAASVTRLLKFENDTVSVLVKDGDLTPEGDALQNLGSFGLAVEQGKVFFPALTARGPGVYELGETGLRTVIPPGVNNLGGIRPAAIVLHDVADDTLVLYVADQSGNRRLVANLASPAVPVILSSPTNLSVLPGARVELRVTVLGDAPLTYAWKWSSPTGEVVRSTTDTLVLDPVTVADAGYYTVLVTNSLGAAQAPNFLLNVEAPPQILVQPVDKTLEAGDQLRLDVTAIGGFPLSYFWTKDGVAVTNDTTLGGVFIRTVPTVADSGRYRVTVSNAWGQVTSAEAVVTVTPAPPNPVYNGGRFTAILGPTTLVPNSNQPFDLSGASVTFRVLDGRLIFSGGPATNRNEGIFAWENGTLTRLVGAGATLPNGLGVASGFTLLPSALGEPLAVVGYRLVNGVSQRAGFYRVNGGTLEVVVDVTTPAPGFAGTLFPSSSFFTAVQAGGRIVFGTRIGSQSALYRAGDGDLVQLVNSTQNLPVVGAGAIQFRNLAFDGTNVVFVADTAGLQQSVVLRRDAAGEITALLAKGDPIPGTSDTVSNFGSMTAEGGAVFIIALNSALASNWLEWREGTLRRIAGPGMPVRGGGTVQTVSGLGSVAGGKVYVPGTLDGAEGVRQAVFAASAEGIEPILTSAAKLDGRPGNKFVAGTDGTRVVVGIIDPWGGRTYYANVGPVDDTALRLEFARPGPGRLRFTVPTGTVLEAASGLGAPWQAVEGTGEVEVSLDGPGRFFRLRRTAP
ncbi:immunoglobulin domain-containing protein [Limisphaera sp. VF-2]|jgi:hypothetical protein|uniref:immunoglobulin domain-containing protein n=1 Tax=Limisphaera sp. VF-2 TaxID=3400418 RepID=UPI00176DA27C